MATVIIPTSESVPFTEQVTLDGVVYELQFHFNQREGFWYFNILDTNGVRIKSGIKVVVNFPLILRVTNLARPPGEILALDTAVEASDPGQDELGSRVALAYEQQTSLP